MEYLEALGEDTNFKRGKTQATKALNADDFTDARVIEYLSGYLKRNIIILRP